MILRPTILSSIKHELQFSLAKGYGQDAKIPFVNITKQLAGFDFCIPNNNEIAKDCMSEEEKKYYILLNYRFQQMVPRQTVWNVCLQLHFGGQTMKISWYIEKMMCYVKLSLNTSIKEHDFFKFCSTFHGYYFRTSYQKV